MPGEVFEWQRHTPQTLWAGFSDGSLHGRMLADALLWTYSATDRFPLTVLPAEKWIEMLRFCQRYADGDERFRAPTDELRLYRGAHAAHSAGLSWTPHLRVARVFAVSSHFSYRQPAVVWTVTAPPAAFLAAAIPNEVILDPAGLEPLRQETFEETCRRTGLGFASGLS